MTNIRMTSFTSSIAEHNLHLEESSCHVASNNGLQFFLKQHFDAESSRFNEIQSVLEKVETYGSATEPDSRPGSTSSYLYSQCFQKDQNNNNKRNISSIIETMTISSTYSAGMYNIHGFSELIIIFL